MNLAPGHMQIQDTHWAYITQYTVHITIHTTHTTARKISSYEKITINIFFLEYVHLGYFGLSMKPTYF